MARQERRGDWPVAPTDLPAVILAAGRGTRLGPLSAECPKALVALAGKPLILHVLEGLAQTGIRRAIVVTGYRHQQLEAVLARLLSASETEIIPVFNANYERGNGDSLLAAKPFVTDHFLLTMADHLVNPEIYRRAVQASGSALCVDSQPSLHAQLADATRVWVERGFVRRIGKDLREWNGVDTGVFSLAPTIFVALEALHEHPTVSLTEGVSTMIAAGEHLQALDISGLCWSDVDTADDLLETERLLAKEGNAER